MTKKKKSNKRQTNDTRGYVQQSNYPTSSTSSSTDATDASQEEKGPMDDTPSSLVVVNQQPDSLPSLSPPSTVAQNTTVSSSMASIDLRRFTSRLEGMVDRLLGLGFVESQIERTVQELGFRMTLESALDWLCLNIPTVELPALFTDADLRNAFTTVTTSNSLTVLTFDKSTTNSDRDDNRSFERSVTSQPPTTTIQTPIVDSEETEQNEIKTQKALLVDRYQYVDDAVQIDGTEDDEGPDGEHDSSGEKGEPPTTTTTTSASAPLSPKALALTQQELELAQQESELNQMQLELQAMKDDLQNEANNYLRSKQEIKQLGVETRQFGVAVTKKQRIVEGLRRKLNQTKLEPPPQTDQRVDNTNKDDEDEQCGVLDLFGGGQNEEDEDAPPSSNAASISPAIVTEPDSEQPSESRIDATIGTDWTGKTPQMILEDLCRKKKVSRPKLTKLPYGQGYSLTVVVQTSKKTKETSTWVANVRDFVPNSSIPDYLAAKALYELEPTMPLYHILPPCFRSLWLSWLQEVEETKNQAVSDQKKVKQDRIQYLLSLIPPSSSNDRIEDTDGDHQEHEVDHKDFGDGRFNEGHRPDPHDQAKSDKLREHFTRRMATNAYQEMLRIRNGLPMASYKDEILETVRSSRVTIISAQTGAGKTTQCPQFLLEEALLEGRADQTQILVTQPRRVAATSVAERVSEEMCEPRLGDLVGYQIRMEAVRSAGTKLLFCTTGIVLRRLQDDRTLRGVTHVIVDEVHERQQQTDVLLIALRELLGTTRPDLKIILMSATLDSRLFCDFFGGAPLIEIPGRTFPVASYFLEDCLDATGHIVEEGSKYARRDRPNDKNVHATLWITNKGGDKRRQVVDMESSLLTDMSQVSDGYDGYKMSTRRSMNRVDEEVINFDLLEDVLTLILCHPEKNTTLLAPSNGGEDSCPSPMGSVLVFLPGLGEIRAMTERLNGNRKFRTDSRINNNQQQSFEIIPMHSTLSSKDQKRAFLPSRNGTRKIILSTNIAETSVTIPDVVCVIDTGRVREVRRNKRTLTSVLETVWCSKASAKQRAGRAGRVQPGLCIKLYSSQTEQFVMKAASEPELRRVPLEEICLSILAGGFGKSSMSFLSKAPQPPDEGSVQAAVETLQDIGAIQVTYNGNLPSSQTRVETLTPLGRHLAKLPVDVRLGKMLIFGALFRCLDKALTIAASLSCKSPFVTTLISNDAAVVNAKHSAFASGDSDFETYCSVWQAYNETLRKEGSSSARKFCQTNYLSLQVMREINDARRQYLDLLCGIGLVDRTKVVEDWTMSMYNEYGNHDGMINAVFCAGLYPNIAHLIPTKGGNGYVLCHKTERLHFHQSSVNARKTKKHATEFYLCFHEKFGTGQNRVSVSTTCSVHPYALILFGGNIEVKHVERRVVVDGWIELSMAAQIGALLKEFRKQFDGVLLTHLLVMERQLTSSNKGTTSSITAKNEKDEARETTNIMVQGIAHLLSSSPSAGITKDTFHATSRLSGGA